MNTVESLYRYYKKVGPISFDAFIEKHPELLDESKLVKKMDEKTYAVAVA